MKFSQEQTDFVSPFLDSEDWRTNDIDEVNSLARMESFQRQDSEWVFDDFSQEFESDDNFDDDEFETGDEYDADDEFESGDVYAESDSRESHDDFAEALDDLPDHLRESEDLYDDESDVARDTTDYPDADDNELAYAEGEWDDEFDDGLEDESNSFPHRLEAPTFQYLDPVAAGLPLGDNDSVEDEANFDGEIQLSQSKLSSAVEYNRSSMGSLGWQNHYHLIVSQLFKINYSPDEKRFAELVANWQDDNGLNPDGKIGGNTWGKMKIALGLSSKPSSSSGSSSTSSKTTGAGTKASDLISAQMPRSASGEYQVRNQQRAYALPETIAALQWMAKQWHKKHPDIILKVLDISKKGGGLLKVGNKHHKSHRIGLDVDLQFLRLPGKSEQDKINTLTSQYTVKDRDRMRYFINIALSNPILDIKVIFYTESVLEKEFKPKVKVIAGHNKHMHVRFRVPSKYRNTLKKVAKPGIPYYEPVSSKSEYDYDDEIHTEELVDHDYEGDYFLYELSDANLASAVNYNRAKAKSVGWYSYFDTIVEKIFVLNYSPTEEEFARKVAEWQNKQGIHDDGKLGPNTWKKMQPYLGIATPKKSSGSSGSSNSTKLVSYKQIDWNKSEENKLFSDFLDKYRHIKFKNADDINNFFNSTTGLRFCQWFRDKIGNRGFFGKIPSGSQYARPGGGRNPKTIKTGEESNFNKIFNNIPILFAGDKYAKIEINLLQFFALIAIIINEHGGRFTVGSEHGTLNYLFRYNPKNGDAPGLAYNLLNSATFMAAHKHRGKIPKKPYSHKWKQRGKANYPAGMPTSVADGGLISEMDFCKFRGRGLIQITFRGAYKWLINHLLNRYSSSHPLIKAFQKKYAGKSVHTIATISLNEEWDALFEKTGYEIACLAVYVFQKNKRDFLQIGADETQLKKESTYQSGAGSLFYVGYRQGGNRLYGRCVKKRVMQMMAGLL